MIVSTLSGLSLYDGYILHLELSDKTCWSTRNSTLAGKYWDVLPMECKHSDG